MRVVTGNGFFRGIVREELLSVPDGNMRAIGDVVRIPQSAEGPFLTKDNWLNVENIIKVSDTLDENKKNRLNLACELTEKAARAETPTKFFLYWVALEVLCDTHEANDITRLLFEAYDTSKEYILTNLGFKRLIRRRQDLFHEGKHHDTPQDVERYLQVVFLDIVRACLGLSCQKHIEAYVQAGFDISRLEIETGRNRIKTVETAG